MKKSSIVFTLFFLLLSINPIPLSASNGNNSNANACSLTAYSPYVRNACNVTLYQRLCIRTLSPFSSLAKNNSSIWARAGVAVTVTETKQILRLLLKTRRFALRKRERIAMSDCRELFVDSLDNLYKSLAVVRKLDETQFLRQMSDLATWLSAALTDDDTCLDGFEEIMSVGASTVRIVRRRVTKCMYLCSNALALLNKLAHDGL